MLMIEPPPLALHHRNDVLHGEERALEIDREDAIPFRLGDIDDASHLGNADIVVEHVDAAVGFQAGGDHGFDIGGARHISGEWSGAAAFGGDDISGFLRGFAVAVDAEHLGAVPCKGGGGCFAVAPARPDRARADDERRLCLPAAACFLPLVFADAY